MHAIKYYSCHWSTCHWSSHICIIPRLDLFLYKSFMESYTTNIFRLIYQFQSVVYWYDLPLNNTFSLWSSAQLSLKYFSEIYLPPDFQICWKSCRSYVPCIDVMQQYIIFSFRNSLNTTNKMFSILAVSVNVQCNPYY